MLNKFSLRKYVIDVIREQWQSKCVFFTYVLCFMYNVYNVHSLKNIQQKRLLVIVSNYQALYI